MADSPLTCNACPHAPAILLAAIRRTYGDRTPAPGHVLRLLCGECAERTREICEHGGREVTFLAVAPLLSESQRFQVSEARDILGTWDLANPGGISRETVLADQVRNLLAVVDLAFPSATEASHG